MRTNPTRAELIEQIKKKTARLKHAQAKHHWHKLVENSTKADLQKMLKGARVSRDGTEVHTGLG